MNKKELAASRDASYRVPSGNRCGMCAHGWFKWAVANMGQCHLVQIRGKLLLRDVNLYGICDHFEPKPEKPQ